MNSIFEGAVQYLIICFAYGVLHGRKYGILMSCTSRVDSLLERCVHVELGKLVLLVLWYPTAVQYCTCYDTVHPLRETNPKQPQHSTPPCIVFQGRLYDTNGLTHDELSEEAA